MEGEKIGFNRGQRKKYEIIVILLVVFAVLVAAFSIYRTTDKIEKEKVLISELSQIRSAVITHIVLNKVAPLSLEWLVQNNYSFMPGEDQRSYVTGIKLDKKGRILDPFGNPYIYDSESGWVESSTGGYGRY